MSDWSFAIRVHARKPYQADVAVGLAGLSDGRDWRAGGHVVVRRVAVGARYAVCGMGRRPPLSSRRTRILFVTLEADFRALGRGEFLEAQNCSRLLAAGLQMTARRTVALLARLIAMHVVLEGLRIAFVTRHAETVVVDVLGLSNLGNRHVQRRFFHFLPGRFGVGPVRCRIGRRRAALCGRGPRCAARDGAEHQHADERRAECPACQSFHQPIGAHESCPHPWRTHAHTATSDTRCRRLVCANSLIRNTFVERRDP